MSNYSAVNNTLLIVSLVTELVISLFGSYVDNHLKMKPQNQLPNKT